MERLTLNESAYKEIPNAKRCERMTAPEYDNLDETHTQAQTGAGAGICRSRRIFL